jgi:DNA-binding transcriptional LysR family regulator
MLSVSDLRLLVAIDRARSLSAAARQLRVDHSTAFRRLGALEQRLGVRLFERARDGYTPSPAGETAVAAAARIVGLLEDLDRRLAGHDLRPSGVVRLTTTDTLIEPLAPMIAGFRAAHPAITLEVVTANTFFTLTRRDADVAIRVAAQAPEGLVARRIADVATAAYAARASPRRRPETPLAELDWLSPDESLAHLGSFRWLRANVPAERIVATGNSLLFLRAAAAAGLGAAPLPCYLGDADPALERLGEPLPDASAGLWLITHPDLRHVARVRALLDFAADDLRRQRPVFEGSRA